MTAGLRPRLTQMSPLARLVLNCTLAVRGCLRLTQTPPLARLASRCIFPGMSHPNRPAQASCPVPGHGLQSVPGHPLQSVMGLNTSLERGARLLKPETSPVLRGPNLLVVCLDPVLVLVLQLIQGPRGLYDGMALVATGGVAEAEFEDAAAPAVPAVIPRAVGVLVG
jgi:hypothetical protein